MQWKTHAAITRSVADSLGLVPDLTYVMVEASTEPDRCPLGTRRGEGRWTRSGHHKPSGKIVKILAWKARKAFLAGDVNGGSRALGLAMHYVQDFSVPRCRSWKKHKEFEKSLSTCAIPEQAISIGMASGVASPLFIDVCASSIKPRRDRHQAMFQATAFSAALAAAVLGSLEISDEMQSYLRWKRSLHGIYMPLAIIGGSIVPLACVAPLTGPMIVLVIPFPLALLAWNARKGRNSARLAEWYGVD